MSIDVEAYLFKYAIGDLLTILWVFENRAISFRDLSRINPFSLNDLLVSLVDLVKENGVMEDTHLILVASVE